MEVNVMVMKLAKEVDEELWTEYQKEVQPEDRQYLNYQQWLCFQVMKYRQVASSQQMRERSLEARDRKLQDAMEEWIDE